MEFPKAVIVFIANIMHWLTHVLLFCDWFLYWGLRYCCCCCCCCYLLIDKCGFSVGTRGCDPERPRWSMMPKRRVLRFEVTRVQRASDWVGFVNVTTLACQKEHRHNLVTSFHIPLAPFPLSSIPQSRRHHLSLQNARMNRSIPHIPPLRRSIGK